MFVKLCKLLHKDKNEDYDLRKIVCCTNLLLV